MLKKIWTISVYTFAGIGFVMCIGYFAIKLGLTKTEGVIDKQHDYFKDQLIGETKNDSTSDWEKSEEWHVLREAILKDKAQIIAAAEKAQIEPRLLIVPLVVEQLRLYNNEREIFKAIFAPLRILGNQSQFSWGVMGIKEATAKEVEQNLKNPQSAWYLGSKFEKILDYEAISIDKYGEERFKRLTNEDDRSYSYLYAALLIKQLEKQWENAGFPIEDKPEIVATLFNIGFGHSTPNASPKSGGAEIEFNGSKYSFGGLGGRFYVSNELLQEFPRKTK